MKTKENVIMPKDQWQKLAQDRIDLLEACKFALSFRDAGHPKDKVAKKLQQAIQKAEKEV